jgi:hypothetical protein
MLRQTTRVGLLAAAMLLGYAGPASADAQGNASCIGFEASGVSPVGSSDEFPGGMPELQQFLRDTFGTPTGAVVSEVAHEHLGSHEACDEGE